MLIRRHKLVFLCRTGWSTAYLTPSFMHVAVWNFSEKNKRKRTIQVYFKDCCAAVRMVIKVSRLAAQALLVLLEKPEENFSTSFCFRTYLCVYRILGQSLYLLFWCLFLSAIGVVASSFNHPKISCYLLRY